jgi:nicotinate-nucleotide adenylyltransferase
VIGLLGGTFDPVHNAHLAMARAALKELYLQKVLFIPTGAPHYRDAAVASPEHRIAMLRLALAGEPRYEIDTRELIAGASAYTVDTLRSLRSEIGPDIPLYLLMGADQFAKLDSWHRPEELRKLARIALFARPGFATENRAVKVVPMDPMPISASESRARARRGEDLSGMVPPAVADYIARHKLYS